MDKTLAQALKAERERLREEARTIGKTPEMMAEMDKIDKEVARLTAEMSELKARIQDLKDRKYNVAHPFKTWNQEHNEKVQRVRVAQKIRSITSLLRNSGFDN